MFEPICEMEIVAPVGGSKLKRRCGEDGKKVKEKLITVPAKDWQWAMSLLKALGKGYLYHEETLRSIMRDTNITIRASSSHSFSRGMEQSLSACLQTGEEAKGNEQKGHPLGKKPDALFRALVHRLYEYAVAVNVKELISKQPIEAQAELSLAFKTIEDFAAKVCHGENGRTIKAARCFKVPLEKSGEIKWIFACPRFPDLVNAIRTVQRSQLLNANGLFIADDHAPQCTPSKDVKSLLYGKGKGKGKATWGGS
jgi:hypothetical protein